MGCSAYMDVRVTVSGKEHFEEAERWGKEMGFSRRMMGENLVELYNGWDASWIEEETEQLAEDLSSLGVPVSAWDASVDYFYDDEPYSDGARVEFNIIDGEIWNYKESRVEMVAATPRVKFELKEEK